MLLNGSINVDLEGLKALLTYGIKQAIDSFRIPQIHTTIQCCRTKTTYKYLLSRLSRDQERQSILRLKPIDLIATTSI